LVGGWPEPVGRDCGSGVSQSPAGSAFVGAGLIQRGLAPSAFRRDRDRARRGPRSSARPWLRCTRGRSLRAIAIAALSSSPACCPVRSAIARPVLSQHPMPSPGSQGARLEPAGGSGQANEAACLQPPTACRPTTRQGLRVRASDDYADALTVLLPGGRKPRTDNFHHYGLLGYSRLVAGFRALASPNPAARPPPSTRGDRHWPPVRGAQPRVQVADSRAGGAERPARQPAHTAAAKHGDRQDEGRPVVNPSVVVAAVSSTHAGLALCPSLLCPST